jgi:hypothetical protein
MILRCDEEPTWESQSSPRKSSGDAQNSDLMSVTSKKEKSNDTDENQLTDNKFMVQRVFCCFTAKRNNWKCMTRRHVLLT